MFTFITGFQQQTTNLLSISSYTVPTPTTVKGPLSTVNLNPSDASYIYMQNPTDTQVGLTIIFHDSVNANLLTFVQFSVIFVGLRSFSNT